MMFDPKILARTIFFIGTVLLSSIAVCGQDVAARPVARLISTAADVYARPRRTREVAANPATASPTLNEASDIERRAFDVTNEVRLQRGLAPLAWDGELCRLAREHSEKMAREHFFSHETPQGRRLRDRARDFGIIRFRWLAENIAFNKGFPDPGAFAVERWMISEGHRANILHSGFEGSAVGVFISDDGSVYLTQAFITR